jgi:hypothetical protein
MGNRSNPLLCPQEPHRQKRPLFRARDSHAPIADPPLEQANRGYAPETVL